MLLAATVQVFAEVSAHHQTKSLAFSPLAGMDVSVRAIIFFFQLSEMDLSVVVTVALAMVVLAMRSIGLV